MKIVELFEEIRKGNGQRVEQMLTSQVDMANQYLYGVTPLLYSIECGREDCSLVKFILSSVQLIIA